MRSSSNFKSTVTKWDMKFYPPFNFNTHGHKGVNSFDNKLAKTTLSGEFDLVSVSQKRRIVKYTCCDEPYPDLTFYIHIRRMTLYYLYNIIFPW